MTRLRNQTIVKQVMARDLGLCVCCGFKASEIHHIIPLVYGGEDRPENMVALCHICHEGAPDKKEDFVEYMKKGGAKTFLFYGMVLAECEKLNLNFVEILPVSRSIINSLKNLEAESSLEKYNLKDIDSIPNAIF